MFDLETNNFTNKHIVILGSSGFPHGLAAVQKTILISKCLVHTGNSVTVVNDRGIHNKKDFPELTAEGSYEGIKFVYTSGSPFAPKHFLKRNLQKINGKINEYLFLKRKRKNNSLDYAILTSISFHSILYHCLLSKLLKYKTILNYVEFYSGTQKKWFQIYQYLNDKLFDNYAPLLVDAVFPISEYLIGHIAKINPQKKYIKIPILVDMERGKDSIINRKENYFLFSGATTYMEIIKFIIDSFKRLNHQSTFLYLVINGNNEDLLEINRYIDGRFPIGQVKVFSKLTDNQLDSFYQNAIGLLIPLRPTTQDRARFPHKIGEYLASGNPVVSTNYGEVKYYFKDMHNMLIANSYDTEAFASKMQYIIDNPVHSQAIGENGKKTASTAFKYQNYIDPITNFILNI